MKQCLLCEEIYTGRNRLCANCWTETLQKEWARVQHHNKRAIQYGLPATLTLQEWIATLNYFEWKCAYCLSAPYKGFDHFIPFNICNSPLNTIAKGTSSDNCVPCCRSCNSRKSDKSPEYILKFYTEESFIERTESKYPTTPKSRDFFPTKEMVFRIAEFLGLDFSQFREMP